jgi:hypothetical protein
MQTLHRTHPAVQPSRRRVKALLMLALSAPLDPFASPAVPILPFAVGIARPACPGRSRAPKGGLVVAGRFYKGGQLLPATADATPAPATNLRDSWPSWADEDRWTIVEPAASEIDLTAFATRAESPVPLAAEFSIHGFRYAAREIPAGECGTVAFELYRPDTNHHYHVIRDGHGLVACDCPDYLMRREGTGAMCKHGSKLVELGMIPAPSPVLPALGRRESITPSVSVPRDATPDRIEYLAPRPRRFEPSPAEMTEAAQLFADAAGVC